MHTQQLHPHNATNMNLYTSDKATIWCLCDLFHWFKTNAYSYLYNLNVISVSTIDMYFKD